MGRLVVGELELAEFRGVRRLAKPIKLRQLNIVVGRNGAGKTALLEALYILAMPYQHVTLPLYGLGPIRYVGRLHGGVGSLVYGYAGRARLSYRLAELGEVVVEVDTSGFTKVSYRSPGGAGYEELAPTRYQESILKPLGVEDNRRLLALFIPDTTGIYESIGRYLVSGPVWAWVEKHGLHRRVVEELLAGTVYDRYTEVTVRWDKLHVRKEVEGGIGPLYINLDSLGEGVRRVVLVYLAAAYLRPRLLLWDDIEVALHPTLIDAVVRWLEKLDAQVVAATHSIDVLYRLAVVKPRDAQVIVLSKTGNDTIQYRVIGLDELEEMFEKGVDARLAAELGL